MAKAKKKSDKTDKATSRHQQIESEETDPLTASARVSEETSSDGKFSTYEYTEKKDDRDGDLIIQWRGEPHE